MSMRMHLTLWALIFFTAGCGLMAAKSADYDRKNCLAHRTDMMFVPMSNGNGGTYLMPMPTEVCTKWRGA